MPTEAPAVEEISLTEEHVRRLAATGYNIQRTLNERRERELGPNYFPAAQSVVHFFDYQALKVGKLFETMAKDLRSGREVKVFGGYNTNGALMGTSYVVSTGMEHYEGWPVLNQLHEALFVETASPGFIDEDAPNLGHPLTDRQNRRSIVLKLVEEAVRT